MAWSAQPQPHQERLRAALESATAAAAPPLEHQSLGRAVQAALQLGLAVRVERALAAVHALALAGHPPLCVGHLVLELLDAALVRVHGGNVTPLKGAPSSR